MLWLAATMLLLAGCAVSHTPTELTPLAITEHTKQQTLTNQLTFELGTGYSRTLKAGSQWISIGRVPQGEVYKPYKDVFTLEGANVHEAYLVVDTGRLIGFYLPVERGYSPLKQALPLPLQTQEPQN